MANQAFFIQVVDDKGKFVENSEDDEPLFPVQRIPLVGESIMIGATCFPILHIAHELDNENGANVIVFVGKTNDKIPNPYDGLEK